MVSKSSATEYLTKSEAKLHGFKREWDLFTTEVPEKLLSLARSGIKPTFSRSDSYSSHEINYSITFESNMDAVEDYLEDVKTIIDDKKQEIHKYIETLDNDLQFFLEDGVDADCFSKLIRHLNEWISYIPKMSFDITKTQTVEISPSMDVVRIKKKWDEISNEELRKKEAEKYGVSLSNLDKHKAYLEAKSQKSSAKTSASMKKAEKAFTSIKDYLDSADLAKSCATAAAELKFKEDEEARIKKELEEARKREEAERLRKAVEAYEKELAEVTKAKEAYIAAETESIEEKHKKAMDALKSDYDVACTKNKGETEKASAEKTRLEQELEEAGLFAFGKKKQLRAEIEALAENLRCLATEKKNVDSDYEKARTKQKDSRESALKVLPMNAGKKYPMPKDPRK